ncbi:single-stranded-DNA-specific exonuclease RecJ [Enterovirga rhinocerotis]|uniref:Single-stranded-DNA-specific exonuclease RecJ n=1 Tax=Enterovirga rhinocerotis TaxID=1339210 RepID=A0A4R7BYR1_9HYPH|nr:single-stranded-DNA-specific exonuclease RecJ [Enterovirga rhinocerotis]TDR89186.1 exonuclease RecJ [Enterovirga rhinocerotis]
MSESATAPGERRALLGVEHSALGRRWQERLAPEAGPIALAIAQTHGLPDLLARILASRGVGVQAVPAFLAPRLRDLMPDPSRLTAMDVAAARLADAILNREKVAIFGDYDVDGACSSALLADYLTSCGTIPAIHIPDRMTEGYGPNVEAIRRLAEEGARLIVTVDCGTAGQEPLAEAARLGVDIVVLDHHGAPETLPPAVAIVNPNRLDDLSGLGHLAAAGIVFMALVALARELRSRGFFAARPEPDLLAGLDLVALATIADVVPLTGLNRAFVRQGLAVMKQRRRVGLSALADAARLAEAPEAWHLGFLLGPRINAGGRIGDSSLGARLLLEQDPTAAAAIAETLDTLNAERQAIERLAVEEAIAEADAMLSARPDLPALVLVSPGWHPGIVGLVAARVKERFGRPVFAFGARPDGTATGSGRSIPGVDLGRAVRAAVACGDAVKGGGHAMAAGATVAADGLARFATCLERELGSAVAVLAASPDALEIDGILSAGGASADLIHELDRAGPFGQGQPEPVVALARHRLVDCREVGTGHVRATFRAGDGQTIRAIAFRAAGQPLGQALAAARDGLVHVAGTLSLDRWGGGEKAELRIRDVADA